jgi:predicted MPP superfamily phosphohydrolase
MERAPTKLMLALRIVGVLAAIAVALTILGAWHSYLYARLVAEPQLPAPWGDIGAGLVIAGGLSLLAVPLAERVAHPPWSRVVGWPGSVWLGFAFVTLVLLGLGDLVLLVAGPDGVFADAHGSEALLWVRRRAAVTVVLAVAAVLYGMRSAFLPRVVSVSVLLPRWPDALDGFRIVQITDIHIGPILGRSFAAGLTRRVNELEADLVVITGDLVDGSVAQVGAEVEPFEDLRARHGVAFVTGNHDFYSRADPWCERVRSLGIDVLRNEHRIIDTGTARFVLAGVDDHRGDPLRGGGEDLQAALAGVPDDLPVVLLAHDPTTFKKASRLPIDLQISGHTHGGQIWPFAILVRLVVPFVAGLYRRGAAQLWVSRGTGFWGPPMRIGAPPEITELTLMRAP